MIQAVGDPQEFLKQFFGDGNAIRWEQYASAKSTDTVRSTLEPWVTRFEKQQSPFCLPRVNPETKQTSWYVLCSDPRESRSMRETLQAFVGPTYATFNGEYATLARTDSIDQLCRQHYGSLVFRLPVAINEDRTKVNSLLTTLIDFRDRESSRSLAAIKPIGRLLRDLEMAIIAGNEDSAWQIYSEIRSRGRLSATNLAFLKVHIFGAFGHWSKILRMPNLRDLLQVRRPKRISEQIAKAVYRQFFLQHEEANDVQSAIEAYRNVGYQYKTLVRSTDGLQTPSAIKFSVLTAVAADPPNRKLAERLADNCISDTDCAWCESLLSTLETSQAVDIVPESIVTDGAAELRYNEGDFDEAFELYIAQTPTYQSVCRVLETAVEIDIRPIAEKAIAYLNGASDDVQEKVLKRKVCANNIETLSTICGQSSTDQPKPISSFVEWFACVDEGGDTGNLNQVLDYGIHEWASGPPFDAATTAALLTRSRTGKAAETVRNAVPLFIREFLADLNTSRENKLIYSSLIELLIYDEMIGSDDLGAVEQLLEAILTTAPSHESGNNDFVFAVDVIRYLWETTASPRHLDWALSMLDLLIDIGTQKHADLKPVLAVIIDSSRAWTRRVSDDQWSMLELLANDLNLVALLEGVRPEPEQDVQAEQQDTRNVLVGKSIAVYSLTERIARRFGQLAEQAFDGIKIHYIHDKSLTDRMKSLSQSSDIFIVNTWDAKHAATNGIKDNRAIGSTTLEPSGKSATSLMSSLQEFAASLS